MLFLSILLVFAPVAFALPHAHEHVSKRALPNTWYQEESHPVHNLFKRGPTDGTSYPDVGTPAWSTGFPDNNPANVQKVPQAWIDALNKAVSAGKVPNIPQTTSQGGGTPQYPSGFDATGPTVCSSYQKCRNSQDIWDAPDGVFASSFDDGPLPSTTKLVQFLSQNNATTTHFMIGINIINNPDDFKAAFNAGHDIAVHTWTHPQMTTLSNQAILGELGWTMQLIHNSTGGRVPRYWRPPTGDSDNRVSAIAREVFGLQTIIWNQDTEDWSIATGGTTQQKASASLEGWIKGSKSPGLIILEHELTDTTVGIFMSAFPDIKANGWTFKSVAQIQGQGAYQNSQDLNSPVNAAGILLGSGSNSTAASSSGQAAAASAGPTSSAGSAGSTGASNTNKPNSAVGSFSSSFKWSISLLFGLFLLSEVTA